MKTFQIITDSSCDLPQELADKLELLVLPLHPYHRRQDIRQLS